MKWRVDHIPDQSGRVIVVTGANAGIGFETARALADRGASVILACRNEAKGRAAATRIGDHSELHLLDLADLDSVRAFAAEMGSQLSRVDVLINNAGVMMPPESTTNDGFESQIGINHLGHFALTGLLLPVLQKAPAPRVISLSSIAHQRGEIDLKSFRGEKPYRAMREYQQSKLACLMFALELDRRLVAAGSPVRSLAAHPGITKTELMRHSRLFAVYAKFFAMNTPQGALPTLYAATSPDASGGSYTGPTGFKETRGTPGRAEIAERATNQEMSAQLWSLSESLTGVHFLS